MSRFPVLDRLNRVSEPTVCLRCQKERVPVLQRPGYLPPEDPCTCDAIARANAKALRTMYDAAGEVT